MTATHCVAVAAVGAVGGWCCGGWLLMTPTWKSEQSICRSASVRNLRSHAVLAKAVSLRLYTSLTASDRAEG
jgi:hypothetical protein